MDAQVIPLNVAAFGRLWGEIHGRDESRKIKYLLKKSQPGTQLTEKASVIIENGKKVLLIKAAGFEIKIMLIGKNLGTGCDLTNLTDEEAEDKVQAEVLDEIAQAIREAWVSQESPIMRRALSVFSKDELRLLGT